MREILRPDISCKREKVKYFHKGDFRWITEDSIVPYAVRSFATATI